MLSSEQKLRLEISKLKRNMEQTTEEDRNGKYKAAFAKQRKIISTAFKATCVEYFGDLTTKYRIDCKEKTEEALQKIMDEHKPAVSRYAFKECNADAVMEEIRGISGEFLLAKATIESTPE